MCELTQYCVSSLLTQKNVKYKLTQYCVNLYYERK